MQRLSPNILCCSDYDDTEIREANHNEHQKLGNDNFIQSRAIMRWGWILRAAPDLSLFAAPSPEKVDSTLADLTPWNQNGPYRRACTCCFRCLSLYDILHCHRRISVVLQSLGEIPGPKARGINALGWILLRYRQARPIHVEDWRNAQAIR